MGYTTSFDGKFNVTPALTTFHADYLRKFNETRRMKRDAEKTAARPDPARVLVGLPVGQEGCFFVGAGGYFGQEHTDDIDNFNQCPTTQPGLWCKWKPNDDGTAIVWDDVEKLYDYVEWLDYLIANFLAPWGYKVNGAVTWEGERSLDVGVILVVDNIVTRRVGYKNVRKAQEGGLA